MKILQKQWPICSHSLRSLRVEYWGTIGCRINRHVELLRLGSLVFYELKVGCQRYFGRFGQRTNGITFFENKPCLLYAMRIFLDSPTENSRAYGRACVAR